MLSAKAFGTGAMSAPSPSPRKEAPVSPASSPKPAAPGSPAQRRESSGSEARTRQGRRSEAAAASLSAQKAAAGVADPVPPPQAEAKAVIRLKAASFSQFREKKREALKEQERAAKGDTSPSSSGQTKGDDDDHDDGDGAEAKLSPAPSPKGRPPPAATAGKVGLIYSDTMELHTGPPNHPEQPMRHACVVRRFKSAGLTAKCSVLEARTATDEELLRVHPRAHIANVERMFNAALADITPVQTSGDLFTCKDTAAAARLSAGCAATAVAAVASGKLSRAFAIVRPPGHHAECQRAMGFCFFNNCSVAAAAALATPGGGVARVMIVDWDVHHGNGIEEVHYADKNVLYVSLHRYGTGPENYFYPGTGAVEDCGEGEGKGYNVNIPFKEKGLGDADYLAAFELILEPIARDFRPNLVIIAAGFDAAEGDPLGGMCLSPSGYHHLTRRLVGVAENGRVVAVLEGGYSLSALADCAEATMRGLLGEPAPALGRRCRPKRGTEEALWAVAQRQQEFWPSLRAKGYEADFRLHFASAHLSAASLGR